MNSRKTFFSPFASLLLIGILVAIFTALIHFLSRQSLNTNYSPERHALLEYFVVYICICLFFICLRRFHLQRTKEFLFFGLGFLTFVIFQIFQIIAMPGFHDPAWLPASINLGLGFDVAARILFSIYFLAGILYSKKPLLHTTFRSILMIYINAIAFVVFIVIYFINFLPDILYVNEHTTLLKKGLDGFAAFLMLLSVIFLIRRFFKDNRTIYFWFIVAAVFGIFTNICLLLWNTLFDVFLDAGLALKILFFTSFLAGIFADHFRYLKIEAELRESLEKSKEDLEKSEKTYRRLVEKMADGFIVINKKGALEFCNQAFADMLNYDKEVIIGKHISALFDSSSYEKISLESFHNNDKHGEQHEVEMLTAADKKIPVLINAVPITDARGDYTGFQSVVTNLIERKKIEKNLENLVQEKTKDIEIFRQSIQNSTDGILITDLDGKISYLNRAFAVITGYSKTELIGKVTSVLCYDQRSETAHESIWKSVRDGRIWRGEFVTKRKEGSVFIGEVSVVPINEENGRTVNYLWIEKDITRRKTLERSLEKYTEELTEKTSELETAKSYYETLISGMSDILLVVDNDANCTFLNEYGMKRLKFKADELAKQNMPIFFDDMKRLEKEYGTTMHLEIKDFEFTITSKDGESILCSWHARPLFDRYNRRIGAMAVGRDITEYKTMQNELQEYTKNLENMVKERTKELQKKVNQLARLLEIGEEIRLNVDIDVILNKICEAVQALGWQKVVISLRNYETRTSRPVAAAGLEPEQVEKVMNWGEIPFEHTQKYINEEFQISNSYFVNNSSKIVSKNTSYSIHTELGNRRKGEWHSLDALLVPIRTKDKILGIISIDDPEDRKRPGLEKIRDLEIFADNAALAIENARFFQVQKENENQAKFLVEISQIFHSSLKMSEVLEAIVNKGGKAIGDFCSLLLFDEKGENLQPQATFHENPKMVEFFMKGCDEFPCHVGEGIIGTVVSTGKPLFTSRPFSTEIHGFKNTPIYYIQERYTITSLMLLPLRARDNIIGAMIYLTCQPRRKFKDSEFELAQELANRAALAIENARLFKEAGEKAIELEKANKLKTEFLTNVSHELRTPLNAVITLSDILIRGIPGNLNTEQEKQLQIIQRSGRNLLNLINDILDLSKIESGRVEPIYSVIPIHAVVEETVEHIRPLCVDKGLSLEFECSDEVPEVIYSDQDKITKVLMNILGNAVKFTRKGKIKVRLSLRGDSNLKIEISDTGIGIPQNRIEEIFKEFQQIDSSDSRSYGGTGLGLAITRNVLNILGGSVSVESQIGKGSTFTVIIPFQLKKVLDNNGYLDLDQQVAKNLPKEFEIEITDDRNHLINPKKSVLVIDDEKDAIYIMRQYLHQHNYQIIFPQNGENVMELAKRYNPFAITLDLLMPGQNGWEILEAMKKDKETNKIPIIVTSILSEKERAAELGAAEYLVKPFESRRLIAFLESLEKGTKTKRAVLDLPKYINLRNLLQKRPFLFSDKKNSTSAKLNILLVDDDEDTQYALQYILAKEGYNVNIAREGREAIKKVEHLKPNLILMDIMLPGMNGYETTIQLKSNNNYKEIPIIAMTAKAMKGDREKVLLAGCDDYIAKPFMTKEILYLVEKWITECEFTKT